MTAKSFSADIFFSGNFNCFVCLILAFVCLMPELLDDDNKKVQSVDSYDNAKNHADADADDTDDTDDADVDASDCTLTLPAVALSSNPLLAGHF